MTAFATFYDLLMPELPGCTTQMVDLQLRQVARDFCLRTRAWRGPLTPVDTVALQSDYAVTPLDPTAAILRIHKLTVNEILLWDDTWQEDDPKAGEEPEHLLEAPFRMSDDLMTIILADDEIPEADLVGGLTGTASLQPLQDAASLPDLLWLVHSEAMRCGTLARLMNMPEKPWTSVAGAMHASKYEAAVQYAATTAQRGNNRGLLRTRKVGT